MIVYEVIETFSIEVGQKMQQTENSPANFSYDYRIPLNIRYQEGFINKNKEKYCHSFACTN